MATKTLLQGVNDALLQEMERDDRVLVFGEDVGLNEGVFRATSELQKRFGKQRAFSTPLTETGIIGVAIGMALYGLKPVPEIQFADFVYPAFDQIVSELAKFRYRSGGEYPCPVVVRMPYGGGIRGGLYHSQSPEAYFCHTPGLKVVIPSTPADAKGLLASAIRGDDPVIFMEPKKIYRSVKGEVPDEDILIPIGPARIAQTGTDVTLFSFGAMVPVCMEAAEKAHEKLGVSVEVVDLRTLYPLDEATIIESVQKTGRAIVVTESPKTCGYGSEIAALIAERALDSLEAPVVRVAGFDTPFPYTLEKLYVPDALRVFLAIQDVVNYQ